MNKLGFWVLLFLNKQVFSAITPNNVTLSNVPLNTCFSTDTSENLKMLKDPSFLNLALPSMEEVAKKVCNYKIKPEL